MTYFQFTLIALCLCCICALLKRVKTLEKKTEQYQYIIYLGLKDKDTGEQKISEEEAIDILNKICPKYVVGYNMHTSEGFWNNEGEMVLERSIVISFNYIIHGSLYELADEIVEQFNQECVFIEQHPIGAEFYPREDNE